MGPYFLTRHRALRAKSSHWPTTTPLEGSRSSTGSSGKSIEPVAVDRACGCPVVSCADILAVAARDSVVALGGPYWKVKLGRRDATRADINTANANLPAPFMGLPALIESFERQGLDTKDLIALSGGHTIGFAQCFTFRDVGSTKTPTLIRVSQDNAEQLALAVEGTRTLLRWIRQQLVSTRNISEI